MDFELETVSMGELKEALSKALTEAQDALTEITARRARHQQWIVSRGFDLIEPPAEEAEGA